MSPSTIENDVVTVGPEDVDAPGELAPKVVKAQQAHELIKHVRANYPVELVVLEQRDEDRPRSAALDANEVLAAAQAAFGGAEEKGGVVKVHSARVRGKTQPIAEKAVCVLWQTPSGRTARGAIPYALLSSSLDTFDRKVASGEITEVDESDAKDLKRTVERQQEQITRLNAKLADGEGGDPAAAAGLTQDDVKQMIEEALPTEAKEALEAKDAQIAELEAKLAEQDASAGGTPEETPEPEPEPEPEPVTVPEGNAKDLIAAMGDYSAEQLAAIVAEDGRSSVVKAAEAEQQRRPDTE